MTALSPHALQTARGQLLERGWTVLRGVVESAELAALRDAFDRCVGLSLPPVAQRPGAHTLDPSFRAWVLDGRMGQLGAALLHAETVRLLQDALIAKPAGRGGEVAWHQDASYLGYLPHDRLVSVRLALGPETLEDGGLEVLDRSHVWPEPPPSLRGAESVTDGLARLPPERRSQVERRRTEVLLAAGDLSVHLPRTWHRSAPNTGPGRRRTVVSHLFDAAARVDLSRIESGLRDHLPVDPKGHLTGPRFPVLR
ncbi:MAG: phytanoyl-CoA dioxygenase family protein [Deltaproteobacteria bacterium]|nr:phytanoyl-CoA dioxygenase family protein [Deltaproteobacteria bacterium]